jgi:hypothetical protein
MTLTIFISKEDFTCLNRIVPVGSHSKKVLAKAVNFADRFSVGNYVITCDENEARNLLMYARAQCPGTSARIGEAFRAANLASEDREP